jgi:YD repeat-containing protein
MMEADRKTHALRRRRYLWPRPLQQIALLSVTAISMLSQESVAQDPAASSSGGSDLELGGHENLIERREQVWANGDWADIHLHTYDYNGAGNRTEWIFQRLSGEVLENLRRTLYSYDTSADTTEVRYELWTGTDWETGSRDLYAYDAGNRTGILRQNWTDSVWVDSRRQQYTFDDAGNLIERTSQNWEETAWDTLGRDLYTHDADGRRVSWSTQRWTGTEWENIWRSLTSYHEEYMIVEVIDQSWTGTEWEDLVRKVFVYDESGNLEWTRSQEMRDGIRQLTWLSTFTYDEFGNLVEEMGHTWADPGWQEHSHTAYTHDASGNVLTETRRDWSGVEWEFRWRIVNTYEAAGAPDQVVLLDPADGATGVPSFVMLSWQPQDGTQFYHLQIDRDSSFAAPVVESDSIAFTTLTMADPLSYSTTYFWRVRAGVEDTTSDQSSLGYGLDTVFASQAKFEAALNRTGTATGSDFSGSYTTIFRGAHFSDDCAPEFVRTHDFHVSLPVSDERLRELLATIQPDTDEELHIVQDGGRLTLEGVHEVPVDKYWTSGWIDVDGSFQSLAGYYFDSLNYWIVGQAGKISGNSIEGVFASRLVLPDEEVSGSCTWAGEIVPNQQGKSSEMIFGAWSEVRSFTVAVGTATEGATSLPTEFALHPAYPNPFNPSTTIGFDLPRDENVRLTIYDALGRLVESLVNSHRSAGRYTVTWDAEELPSGVYFVRIEAGAFTTTQVINLVK